MEPMIILKIEQTNHHHIYLYNPKGKVWSCYGRSALLLHRLYPNIPYKDRDISGMGDVLPVMIIDLMTLEHLIKSFPPIERDMERMVIEISESGWVTIESLDNNKE